MIHHIISHSHPILYHQAMAQAMDDCSRRQVRVVVGSVQGAVLSGIFILHGGSNG